MNRSPRDRWTALLAAVVFLLSGAGDAFGAHACPHHAAIGAPAYAAAAGDDAVGQAHAAPSANAWDALHAAHAANPSRTTGAAHADASHGPGAPSEHDGHDACTCGGVCPLSTGPAPLATTALVRLPVDAPAAAPVSLPDPTRLPARLTAHLLPFAQAPPRLG